MRQAPETSTHPNVRAKQLGARDRVASIFPGGGIAGDILRGTDWSTSALGPVDAWSMSLKALVRAMLNTRQATCLLWGPDLVNLYNDGFVPILGEKHPWAMGQRGQDVWSDTWPVVGERLGDVVRHGHAVLIEEMLIPIVRGGRLEDAWWNYSYSPAFDDTGAIAGVLVVATETTGEVVGRRRSEATKIETELAGKELHDLADNQRDINERLLISSVREHETADTSEEKRAQLSALLEALFDGVVIADPSGQIRMMNAAACRILGFDADVHTTAVTEALDLRDLDNAPLPAHGRPLHRALHGESFADGELLLVHPDGETRRLETSGTSILEGGKVALAIVVLRDVTEQRRLEREREELAAQLRESLARAAETDQFKEQFIGILGHDLRNPLNAILMAANLIQGKCSGDDQAKPAATIIRSAQRMANMVAQLLDLTRSRLAGGIAIERERTDLSSLITTVVDELRTACPTRAITWESAGRVMGAWDSEKLAQVVSNLVGNGLGHGDPRRPVLVRLTDGDTSVILDVQNYGPIIAPELLPTLFEPYRRGDARDARSKGLGLGLFIAEQIVTAHGGRIEVRSTLDEGTTFRVTLPRME